MVHASTETLSRTAARTPGATPVQPRLTSRDRAIAIDETLIDAVRAGGRFRSHEVQALLKASADAWAEVGLGVDAPAVMSVSYAAARQGLVDAYAREAAVLTYDKTNIGRAVTKAEKAAQAAAGEDVYQTVAALLAMSPTSDGERADQVAIAEKLEIPASDIVAARSVQAWPDRYDTVEKWREIAPHFTEAECASMAAKTAARITADEPRFADLVLKFKEIGLDIVADHAAKASAHGMSFDGYILDALRVLDPNTPDPRTQWAEALAAFEAADKAMDETGDRVDSICEAAAVAAPYPPELLDKAGDQQSLSDITDDTKRPFSERVARAEKWSAWSTDYSAALDQQNIDEAEELSGAAYDTRTEALVDLIDAPAPDASAAAYKLRIWLDRAYCGKIGYDIDDPETVAELLAETDIAGPWAPVRVYQDLLRLSGLRPELHDPIRFDPSDWLLEFEKNPGHRVGDLGFTARQGAWGEPSKSEFVVNDPAAVSRHWDAYEARAKQHDHLVDPSQLARWRAMPLRLTDDARLAELFPEGGPEHDRLAEVWKRNLEARKGGALAAHQWRDLPPWKRDAVRAVAKERYARVGQVLRSHIGVHEFLTAIAGLNGAVQLEDGSLVICAGPSATTADELNLNEARYWLEGFDQLEAAVIRELSQ